MRRLLTLLTALLGFTVAQAYVPLVREGVEWIYYENRIAVYSEFDYRVFHRFFGVCFDGDTVINNHTLKRCLRYELGGFPADAIDPYSNGAVPAWRDFSQLTTSNVYPVAYMAEVDGLVISYTLYYNYKYESYETPCYYDDWDWWWERPGNPYNEQPVVLYDFHNPESPIWQDEWYIEDYQPLSPVVIDGQTCRRFRYASYWGFDDGAMTVEGVGFDSRAVSDLTMPYRMLCECLRDESTASLVCVRNKADGRIIYKGRGFEYWPFASEPADVNADAVVDVTDLGLVIDTALGLNTLPETDINGDGTVDVADINTVITAMLSH